MSDDFENLFPVDENTLKNIEEMGKIFSLTGERIIEMNKEMAVKLGILMSQGINRLEQIKKFHETYSNKNERAYALFILGTTIGIEIAEEISIVKMALERKFNNLKNGSEQKN